MLDMHFLRDFCAGFGILECCPIKLAVIGSSRQVGLGDSPPQAQYLNG